MANVVASVREGSFSPSPTGFTLVYNVVFAGTDVPGGVDYSEVTVDLLYGDAPGTMTTKVGTAVRTEATRLLLTIPSNGITLTNSFTKT